MTVYISADAKNLREELASLRNQGGYEERQFYFDGLVTNGTFDVDTNWTKGTGWTISGGTANKAAGTSSYLEQVITTVVGASYVVEYNVTAYSGTGSFQLVFGALAGTAVSATGTYVDTFVATSASTTFKIYAGSGLTGSVDNVSVFETDGTDVVHRMPKGWVPKDVYEDGLLQREGAANDYEVVYDGFDYYVKPAVAPSATTQTCVIGVRK